MYTWGGNLLISTLIGGRSNVQYTKCFWCAYTIHLWQTSSLVWNYCTLGWPRGPPPLQTWEYKTLEKHPCIFVLCHESFWNILCLQCGWKPFWLVPLGSSSRTIVDLPEDNEWMKTTSNMVWILPYIKCLKCGSLLSFRCQPSNIVLPVSNIKYEITNINYCLPTIFSVPVTEKRALRMSWKYSLFKTSYTLYTNTNTDSSILILIPQYLLFREANDKLQILDTLYSISDVSAQNSIQIPH